MQCLSNTSKNPFTAPPAEVQTHRLRRFARILSATRRWASSNTCKYVQEELLAETRWHEILADKMTACMTQPHFVAGHALWFTIWIAINLGTFAWFGIFDASPFFLLVTILAIETLFIT